jgi:hypothetical protein
LIALTQLAPEIPLFGRVIEAFKKRFPAVFEKAEKMKVSLKGRFGRP